jgi:hypothetical protein
MDKRCSGKSSKQGWTDGRARVVADETLGIIGIGDHAVRKEAEKLAAYSACLQLVKAGKVRH